MVGTEPGSGTRVLLLGLPHHPGPRRSRSRGLRRQVGLLRRHHHERRGHSSQPDLLEGRVRIPDPDAHLHGPRRRSDFSGHERPRR